MEAKLDKNTIVIVKVPPHYKKSDIETATAELKKLFPNNKVLIVPSEFEITFIQT